MNAALEALLEVTDGELKAQERWGDAPQFPSIAGPIPYPNPDNHAFDRPLRQPYLKFDIHAAGRPNKRVREEDDMVLLDEDESDRQRSPAEKAEALVRHNAILAEAYKMMSPEQIANIHMAWASGVNAEAEAVAAEQRGVDGLDMDVKEDAEVKEEVVGDGVTVIHGRACYSRPNTEYPLDPTDRAFQQSLFDRLLGRDTIQRAQLIELLKADELAESNGTSAAPEQHDGQEHVPSATQTEAEAV